MIESRVAVVTGANKGIGYAIVKKLCQSFNGVVYLTARDSKRGELSAKALCQEGLNPTFYQLDISDQHSVDKFRDHLRDTYGGLDVLVNNAGVGTTTKETDSPEEYSKKSEQVILINNEGTQRVCDALFPLLRPHARVVNVSSQRGMLQNIPSKELRARFASPDLTIGQLNKVLQEYIDDVKTKGRKVEKEWGLTAYRVSKAGVTALTKIQQRAFDSDPRTDLIVNAVHPGYVRTDMTKHQGDLSIEEGSEAPVYLALLPPNTTTPKGEMIWFDKKIVQWGLDEKPIVE